MTPDEFEQLGVYDPGAPDAPARLELLEHLVGAGVTPTQLARAEQNGDLLAALPDVRLHGPGERVPVAEVVARTALRPEFVRAAWSSAGLADPATDEAPFTQRDVGAFGELAGVADLVGEGAAEAFMGALGEAAREAAERSVRDLAARIEAPVEEGTMDDAMQAEALDTTLSVLDAVPDLFDALFRHHAYAALTRYLEDHPSRRRSS